MKKILISLAIVILCAFLLSACLEEKSDSESANGKYGDALQEALDRTADTYNAPGAVLMVRFADGTVWTGTTGFSLIEEEGGDSMNSTYHFRIGSVTKTFVGTAILLLVQDGELDLSDTVEQWLPGLIPGGAAISVKMLLNHTSGLFDFTHDEDYQDAYVDLPDKMWSPEELIDIANEHDPWFDPGEAAVYSNTNFVLLGMIIEKISGRKIEDFLEEKIFNPLKLENTSFATGPELPEKYAHGYLDLNLDGNFEPDEDVSYQSISAIWAAGAIVSTPANLLAWLDELNDSHLLDEDIQAQRLDFSTPIEGYPEGSFGLGIAEMDGGVGHTGAVIGYTTIAFRYKGVDFVAYCNGYMLGDGAVSIAGEIYKAAVKAVFGDSVNI